MSITLNGTTGISTPDITSTTAPSLVGTNFTSLPSANLTGALPAIDGSSLTGMLSGGTAKAWANFSGFGTVSIRNSFNISSLTDNGTGDYTLNLTSATPNSNYASTFGSSIFGSNHPVTSASVRTNPATTSLRTSWGTTGGTGIVGFYSDDAAVYANVVITL